jgi:drug/metabolite transporter (DMT)-like permease
MLLVSLFQTILEYIFFYIGLSQITGVKGSILTASSSFFVVLLAHFVYKNDKLNKSKFLGCSIGFSGIVLINLNGISSADLGFSLSGDGFMLLSALCFAIGSLISKNICQTADATIVTGYQLGIGGLVLMLLGFLSGGKLSHITVPGVLLLAYMSLLSAIAFTVWTVLSKYNRISQIAVYNFLTPVFGALLSALFLGDLLFTWNNLLALILVCIGIYIVNAQKVSS